MNRCARCLTPPAAAAPSAARPACVFEIRIAADSVGGVSGTSSRKPVRWRARSSSERQAGTTSTNLNSAARSSRSPDAISIARASSARTGWREVDGNEAASSVPTRRSSLLDRGVVGLRVAQGSRLGLRAHGLPAAFRLESPAHVFTGSACWSDGVASVARSTASQLVSRRRSASSAAPPPRSPNNRFRTSR